MESNGKAPEDMLQQLDHASIDHLSQKLSRLYVLQDQSEILAPEQMKFESSHDNIESEKRG